MGTVSFTPISDGSTGSASQVNTPLSTIYNEFNGNITSANLADGALTTTKAADGSITPAKLQAGTGTSWPWQTWTPTWTNLTVGNGTFTYYYSQVGKQVHFRVYAVFGSTSSVSSGTMNFTLPVATASTYGVVTLLGQGGAASSSGGAVILMAAYWQSTTSANVFAASATATYAQYTNTSATVPVTWTTGSLMSLQGFYEAA